MGYQEGPVPDNMHNLGMMTVIEVFYWIVNGMLKLGTRPVISYGIIVTH